MPGQALALGEGRPEYEIVRTLGEGGMAEVFLARRRGDAPLPRYFAVKSIVPAYQDRPDTRRAILTEAGLAQQLHHQNIAEAYGVTRDGEHLHLVLEYVDGVTLKDVIAVAWHVGRRPSVGFCCHVVASVADALHYAHTLAGEDGQPLGIVHRDVKPSNVMITRSGAVKLLDFGVAFTRLPDRELTNAGVVQGTYSYLSPEQATCEPVDHRSDLFSLGIVLVELLTGIRPFDGDDRTPRAVHTSIRADLRAATRRLPAPLAEICRKAMAQSPAARFQDAAALARALRAYMVQRGPVFSPEDCVKELQDLGVLDHGPAPAGAEVVAAPPRRRLPGLVVLATTVTACLLVATVGLALRMRGPARREFQPRTPTVEQPNLQATVKVDAPAPPPSTASVPELPVLLPDPVVRPRKRAASATVRPVVASVNHATAPATAATPPQPALTLPKGILVPAKLTRGFDASGPATVEAVVVEEVATADGVVVPKGSVISCRSRPAEDERVQMSCYSIKTPAGPVTFTGLAVGEGQHAGLRALDTEVSAGSSFVVYVSASDAVR